MQLYVKHEIERCFIYGWFFDELLDEKDIKSITAMQEVFKKKFEEINKKQKVKREELVTTDQLLEEYTR